MTLQQLQKKVCGQNKRLAELGLIILTEGNVSGVSDDGKYMAIKPSGVPYGDLTPEKIVIVELKNGAFKGKFKPSSDAPTHVEIYKRFPHIRGIAHTHSPYATAWAQTEKSIPCYGTTHADNFYGDVPVTRLLQDKEIRKDYELNTGKAITEVLKKDNVCGVLVARHAPFCFGSSAEEAVDNCLIVEKIAMLATIQKPRSPLPK